MAKQIINELVSIYETKGANSDKLWEVDLLSNMIFDKQMNLHILLSKEAVGLSEKPLNMQSTSAAFEGWCVAIKAHCRYPKWSGKIILDVKDDVILKKLYDSEFCKNGHYGRFLYRCLRFAQQYKEWFSLSNDLKKVVGDFEQVIINKTFRNNIPKSGGSDKYNKSLTEHNVEIYYKNNPSEFNKLVQPVIYKYSGNLYNQLPVGLFDKEVKTGNEIFTRNKSAVDLWNVSDEVLNIIELKTRNPMIGIITEIFFYCNYCRDLFSEMAVFEKNNSKTKLRGYGKLCSSEIKKVDGILFADRFNPVIAINDRLLDVLCTNETIRDVVPIQYYKVKYDLQTVDNTINIIINKLIQTTTSISKTTSNPTP